jgi:hypothetical protein
VSGAHMPALQQVEAQLGCGGTVCPLDLDDRAGWHVQVGAPFSEVRNSFLKSLLLDSMWWWF